MAFAHNRKKAEEKVLDVNASMQGTMNFKEKVNLRINGEFSGSLELKGNLNIAPSAVVTADIIGDNVIVGGKVRGRITARERLTLLPSAVVEGDIYPTKLNIAEGAIFEGCCSMLHDFMSSEELARYLEIDLNSVLEWANTGKMPGLKEGSEWRFDRKAIDSWVAAEKVNKK